MLKFYWDNVFRFHIKAVALIAAMALLASFLQVANLGMIIPIVGILASDPNDLSKLNFPFLSNFAPYVGDLSAIRFFQVAATAELHVLYYVYSGQ